MDLITIIGIGGGFLAILLSALWEGTELSHLVHPAAMLIIAGGTLGATAACYSLAEMLCLVKSSKEVIKKTSVEPADLIRILFELATLSRREGVLAMEHHQLSVDMPLLKRGIRLVVDGTAPELLKDLLLAELSTSEAALKRQGGIFQTAGGFAPTMGIIGTVVGLVHVLGNLAEPALLGKAIAGAFLATLYGIGVANLVLLPLAKKMHFRAAQEFEVGSLVVEGLVSIQHGDNPRLVQEKLLALVSEEDRARVVVPSAEEATKKGGGSGAKAR